MLASINCGIHYLLHAQPQSPLLLLLDAEATSLAHQKDKTQNKSQDKLQQL